MATKKVAKKAAAPKPAKVAKTATATKTAPVDFVSFSVRAVIPVQQYGNIQPEIVVNAKSYEAARDYAMPKIEELWKTYAERPVNGNAPAFVGPVTVAEKNVAQRDTSFNPTANTTASNPPADPKSQAAQSSASASSAPAPAAAPSKPKSEAVMKAERAISLATTTDAILAIQDQIEKSVKIAPEDKGDLITLVLKKRNELK